jgi:hypothetical protein
MLDLKLIKPGDLVTNTEGTYVHLVLELTSKITHYDTTEEDIIVETLDTLVLDRDGNIVKDVLYSDLDHLVI